MFVLVFESFKHVMSDRIEKLLGVLGLTTRSKEATRRVSVPVLEQTRQQDDRNTTSRPTALWRGHAAGT